jgi:hypothetical protein
MRKTGSVKSAEGCRLTHPSGIAAQAGDDWT